MSTGTSESRTRQHGQAAPLASTVTGVSSGAQDSVAYDANREMLQEQVEALGPWFHNINLRGVQTAPQHFLGDYPTIKWRSIAPAFPEDMQGASVLDIGCNAGFYSIEMKKRGAGRVLAIDTDDRYLEQARYATNIMAADVELRKMSVYEVDQLEETFDYVLFMGVFYHLRYPALALDKVVSKVGKRLIFQTMLRGASSSRQWKHDYSFWETEIFSCPEFPCVYFIEHSYANDCTNWWIPNRSAAEALLRSAGLEILDHPEEETWVCAPTQASHEDERLFERELKGTR